LGLLGPPQPQRMPQGFWVPALFGAAGAIAGVALVGWARRLRRVAPASAIGDAAPPGGVAAAGFDDDAAEWRDAHAGLDAAEARAVSDPLGAAGQISLALRAFVTRRFGLRADVLTTEELSAAQPPFAMTTRWGSLLEILARLDALRFAEPRSAAEAALELRVALHEARRLLDAHAPVEEAR
jgi:hypothetical protein